MRYVAVVAGYDGILARDGRCESPCIEALRELSASGRRLILATGRELRDILQIFPEARLFDYIVAENGAVMYRTAVRESTILAQAPSEILLQELQRKGLAPLSIGSSTITMLQAHRSSVRDVLRKLGLQLELTTNNYGVLSILPSGVDKAHGVRAALRQMGLSTGDLAAIGDGENDLPLFALARYAAAVRNAAPALKRAADRTLRGAACEGFLEFVRWLTSDDPFTAEGGDAISAPRRGHRSRSGSCRSGIRPRRRLDAAG
jgi:hydroxymethylpyrimidine pyrophosphatase-like HAD family hydrolase